MPKKRTEWTRGEKAMLAVTGIVVLLAVLVTVRWQITSAEPVVTIPTPTLPSPNAFDFYVAADDAVRGEKDIGINVPRSAGWHTLPLADKEALVKANAPALGTLRQGFAHPYHEPPVRSPAQLLSHYAKFRNLARLLSLEGQVKAERGDWGGAASSYLDAVRLGQEIPKGSPLIGKLVGIACSAMGRRPLWEAVERLDAREARLAARRMEAISARHVPFADTLQEEKWTGQSSLLEMFRAPKQLTSAQPGNGGATRPFPERMFFFHSKRKIMANYTAFLDQTIANARRPYAAKLPEPPVPSDPFNQRLTPVFSQARFKDVLCETHNALLTVTLALRAYRAERKAYPARLADLVPVYLKRLPDDPFALNGPLLYKRAGDRYVLYSVGPDGKDDGGKPVENPGKDRPGRAVNPRFFVEADSRGDVVARVNIF